MGRLTNLKPRVQASSQARMASMRAGDERIRGSSLQGIRQRIFMRDAGVCQCARCKRTGDTRPATIVDHIVPLWAGGSETDDNRQSINAECHDLKSRHEDACRRRGWFEAWEGGSNL